MPPLPFELVEKGKEFWRDYPMKYVMPKDKQIIWGTFNTSPEHEAAINEHYFNYVAWTPRRLAYKNRRGLDPQVQCYLDYENIEISDEWRLPIPNEAASFKSLAKYGKPTVILQEQQVRDLNLAVEWMERQFYPYMGESDIITTAEAISRLDMSSSSGFPLNTLYPTKRLLFEQDPDIVIWLEQRWETLATDPLWTTVFSSSLKEELRPKDKILLNKQRTFTAGATDATVLGNRLFVDQNEKMYAAHTVSSSAIGMSPYGGNWNKLIDKLAVFRNGYALDESEYDSSILEFLIWGCAQFRFKCFKKNFRTVDNMQRVKTYYRNLINTLILSPQGIFVMKKLGMPSGCVSTVTDNTLILYTLLAYAWIRKAPNDMKMYTCFEDHTAKALVGDDNTWTVSDKAHKFYNATTVIEEWLQLNIRTTTDSMEPRSAIDLDFLSAHTTVIGGYKLPIYSRDKLMTSVLYAPQVKISPVVTLQRVTNLLQIGWTDEIFREFCRGLIAWLMKEYDQVLYADPDWIAAKGAIFSDARIFQLFTCRKIFLTPQSYQETQERLNTLDNKSYIMSTVTKTIVQKSRNPRRPRGRGPRKGKKNGPGPKPQRRFVGPLPARKRGRNRNARGRGRNTIARNEQVDTSSHYMGGNVVRNTKRLSRPEPFAGDELISPVNGSVAFTTTRFVMNPGNPTSFPWFSRIAQLYERYRFDMLEFYFQHDVSQFNAQGAAGLVILSALYDAASSDPASKVQIEATDPRVICMPNENSVLSLSKQGMHPRGDPKFVRGLSLPGATDIKTYDAGACFVTTQGMAGAGEVGELHVRYKGFLYDRILDSTPAAAPPNFSVSENYDAAAQNINTGASFIPPVVTGLFNGLGINPPVAGVFTLPSGNYLIDWKVHVASGGTFQSTTASLQKNTINVLGGGVAAAFIAAAGCTSFTMNGTNFVTSNGTDTFNLTTTCVFTSTGTEDALIRIVAI